MSKDQLVPPPLINTEGIQTSTIEELMFEYMKAGGSLLTLTELNDIEIDRYSRAMILADWLESKILESYIAKRLLLRISRKRRGRDEIMNMIQASPMYKRIMNMSNQRDNDDSRRIPI